MSFVRVRREIAGWKDSFALLLPVDNVNTAIVFVHGFLGSSQNSFFNFGQMVEISECGRELWRCSDLFFFGYRSTKELVSTVSDDFVQFLRLIFPDPPDWLHRLSSGQLGLTRALTLRSKSPYERLILVGHSEGGLIIRHAIVAITKAREHNNQPVAGPPPYLSAGVRLFAPAIRGAGPTGVLGSLLCLPFLGTMGIALLKLARPSDEMRKATIVNDVKAETERFAAKYDTLQAFRADLVYGADEDVVFVGEYICDFRWSNVKDQNHMGICKPNFNYLFPLEFVADVRNARATSI